MVRSSANRFLAKTSLFPRQFVIGFSAKLVRSSIGWRGVAHEARRRSCEEQGNEKQNHNKAIADHGRVVDGGGVEEKGALGWRR